MKRQRNFRVVAAVLNGLLAGLIGAATMLPASAEILYCWKRNRSQDSMLCGCVPTNCPSCQSVSDCTAQTYRECYIQYGWVSSDPVGVKLKDSQPLACERYYLCQSPPECTLSPCYRGGPLQSSSVQTGIRNEGDGSCNLNAS